MKTVQGIAYVCTECTEQIIQPMKTIQGIAYVCTECTEQIFDSRLFQYNKVFLEKLQ